MKVVLYARVSTDKQDEMQQLPRLRELAKSRGYDVVGEFADVASGKDSNRPQWTRMLAYEKLQHYDAILVTKLDRVMRSVVHLVAVLEDLQSRNVAIISLTDGLLDMSTASGKLQLQIIGAVAEWEREIISERTREALESRRARGVTLGRPRKRVPIQYVASLRALGHSWEDIARITGIPESTLRSRKEEIAAEITRQMST